MASELLITILLVTFIVSVFLTWYFSHKARTKERLILIEKGVDPEVLFRKEQRFKFPWLKVDVLVIGIGVGFGIIEGLYGFKLVGPGNDLLPLSILALCAGASMVIVNYLDKGKS